MDCGMMYSGVSCGVGGDNGSGAFDECDALDLTILVTLMALMTLVPVMASMVTYFYATPMKHLVH